jgi:hypothetical protein
MNDVMRRFCYWCGVGLLIAGAAVAVAELLTAFQGARSTISLGVIWASLNANSLVGFQALIENRVALWLWPPIQFLLVLSAWQILVPLGLLLVVLCRPRTRA